MWCNFPWELARVVCPLADQLLLIEAYHLEGADVVQEMESPAFHVFHEVHKERLDQPVVDLIYQVHLLFHPFELSIVQVLIPLILLHVESFESLTLIRDEFGSETRSHFKDCPPQLLAYGTQPELQDLLRSEHTDQDRQNVR